MMSYCSFLAHHCISTLTIGSREAKESRFGWLGPNNGTSATSATIDLPAVDSDVNVFVTAMNVFGTGGDSDILMDEISELCT